MIATLLIVLIYLAFISLGLPDSILGVTIPALQSDMGLPLAFGGIISMVTIGGTVVSSFLSHRIIKRFGTGPVVVFSTALTAAMILGYSLAPSYGWFIAMALPLGFGGGSIDVALNNFVALHYRAHHMNWLHSFWGVGATLGPVLMSFSLETSGWRSGFQTIGTIQMILAGILALSIPLWLRHNKASASSDDQSASDVDQGGEVKILSLAGVRSVFGVMLLYCALEIGAGLWGSSYLVDVRGLDAEIAARYVALYYGGITVGRFLSGFLSFKLSSKSLNRLGVGTAALGLVLLLLPLADFLVGAGLVIIGVGLAPIFPAMIHETPKRFGAQASQKVIGFQMGFAYVGSAILPPIFGFFFQEISLSLFPPSLMILGVGLLILTERLARLPYISDHKS